MKKNLITLSVISAFTLGGAPVLGADIDLEKYWDSWPNYQIIYGKVDPSSVGSQTQKPVAIGQGTFAVGAGTVAIGQNLKADVGSVAIGTQGEKAKFSSKAVSIGFNTVVSDYGVALGTISEVRASGAVAIGLRAWAEAKNGVAIGVYSRADREGGVSVDSLMENNDPGYAWKSREGYGAISVGGFVGWETDIFTRQITGVAAGSEPTDAVNVAQLRDLKKYGDASYVTSTSLSNYATKDDLNEASSSLTANLHKQNELLRVTAGELYGKFYELRDRLNNAHFIVETPNGGNNPPANDVNGSSPGASGGGGNGNPSSGGNQQGGNASATNSANVYLGDNLNFTTDSNLLTTVTKEDGGPATVKISMAENVSVNSLTANEISAQKVEAENIVATNSLTAPSITFTGGPTLSYNERTEHLQYVSNLTTGGTGQGSVVRSIATTSDGITFGANEGSALVNLDNQKLDIKGADEFITTSIKTNGNGATLEIRMTDEFRIAVGNGNLNNGITIGAKDGYQEIHIHQGNINMGGNRIQGVGDGIAPTDAVNKRQLDNAARGIYNKINKVDKDMRAGVAMAMAVASLPQAYMPGKSMLAMSAGTYRGQGGFALGLSHATENKSWVFKGAATADTRGNFGATIGAGYQF